MKREVEILWRLSDSRAKVSRALLGLETAGVKRTRDTYFYDPKRAALKPAAGRLKECFRLRRKERRCFLAYKVDHFQGNVWRYSDERETEVADGKTAFGILRLLGLKILLEIDMTKHVFTSKYFEVSIEEVRGLGRFIEIESRRAVAENGVETERRRIRKFADGLGLRLGEELNSGKPELLLNKRRKG